MTLRSIIFKKRKWYDKDRKLLLRLQSLNVVLNLRNVRNDHASASVPSTCDPQTGKNKAFK